MRDRDTLLGDRYRLDRRIAVGGMGEVWRAEDTVLHRTVAVKVLKSELTQDPTFLERFRTEARTTASLQHSGIANVFDYGEAPGAPGDALPVAYLVMEYVDGEPLSAQLARDGRLPADRVLEIVRQAALALSEAHRVGMVHRDVKPGNLLVRRSDGAVKITDFGIARAADAVPLTQNGMVVGTAQYFSPEQAEGRVVGPPSDVYSLGVVAYECLAGRLPFVADSPVTVAMMQIRDLPPPLPPDVPAPVQALVLRALAKDPRQRFASGAGLAQAVRAVQEGRRPAPAVPVRPAPVPAASVPVTAVPVPPPAAPFGSGLPSGPGVPGGGAGSVAAPAGSGQGAFSAQSGAAGLGGPAYPTGQPAPPPPAGPAGPRTPAGLRTPAGPGTPAGLGPPGPDSSGGTNPALPYRPWPAPSGSAASSRAGAGAWSGAPPGDPPHRRGSRRPLWISLVLLIALILAAVVTVLLSERGDGSTGRPTAFPHSTTTETLRVR